MRRSQELTIKLSELREKRDGLTEKINKATLAGEDPNEEWRGELDSVTTEIRGAETSYRAALQKEDEEDQAAAAKMPGGDQQRLAELRGKVSITDYLGEIGRGKDATGAADEYRKEVFGDAARSGLVPIEILGPTESELRMEESRTEEHRAVTPVAEAAKGLGSQADILARVFTNSIAMRLGVTMPSVPMGTRTFPLLSSGTPATMQPPSGEQEAVAGSFSGITLGPKRLTGSYEFRVEDLELLAGLEPALREDLRAVITDQMDEQIINGDGAGANVEGLIAGLADPVAAAGELTHDNFQATFTGLVDGINAYMLSDILAVLGKDTYVKSESVYRTNAAEESGYSYMARRMGGLSVSSRIPAVKAKKQEGIAALTSYPGNNAVAPVWNGVEFIRDPYTLAQKGEVRITALMLWNFGIVRETGWRRVQFQTVA